MLDEPRHKRLGLFEHDAATRSVDPSSGTVPLSSAGAKRARRLLEACLATSRRVRDRHLSRHRPRQSQAADLRRRRIGALRQHARASRCDALALPRVLPDGQPRPPARRDARRTSARDAAPARRVRAVLQRRHSVRPSVPGPIHAADRQTRSSGSPPTSPQPGRGRLCATPTLAVEQPRAIATVEHRAGSPRIDCSRTSAARAATRRALRRVRRGVAANLKGTVPFRFGGGTSSGRCWAAGRGGSGCGRRGRRGSGRRCGGRGPRRRRRRGRRRFRRGRRRRWRGRRSRGCGGRRRRSRRRRFCWS